MESFMNSSDLGHRKSRNASSTYSALMMALLATSDIWLEYWNPSKDFQLFLVPVKIYRCREGRLAIKEKNCDEKFVGSFADGSR